MADLKGCDVCEQQGRLTLAVLSVNVKALGKGADLVSKEGKTVDVCPFHRTLTVDQLLFEGMWQKLPAHEGTG